MKYMSSKFAVDLPDSFLRILQKFTHWLKTEFWENGERNMCLSLHFFIFQVAFDYWNICYNTFIDYSFVK